MKLQKGFTLIELVVVMVILGILGAVALPRFTDLGGDARASVMQGVAGSLVAANAMVYAKAAVGGVAGSSASNVVIGNQTVSTAYGYAGNIVELAKVVDFNPSSDFSTDQASNSLRHAKAGANCKIVYNPAISAAQPPSYTVSGITSANCS